MGEIMTFPVIRRPEPPVSILTSRRRLVTSALERLENHNKYEAFAWLQQEFNRIKRELDGAKAD